MFMSIPISLPIIQVWHGNNKPSTKNSINKYSSLLCLTVITIKKFYDNETLMCQEIYLPARSICWCTNNVGSTKQTRRSSVPGAMVIKLYFFLHWHYGAIIFAFNTNQPDAYGLELVSKIGSSLGTYPPCFTHKYLSSFICFTREKSILVYLVSSISEETKIFYNIDTRRQATDEVLARVV